MPRVPELGGMTREVKAWWEQTADYFQDDIDMGVGVDWTGPWAPDVRLFEDDSFDVAFNAWVFQWVGDLEACFAEADRVLCPGGRLVFSMPHPYYDLVDPGTGEIDDSYFDTGRRVTSRDGIDADEVLYRHTVSDVHNAVRSAGFRIESMREPGSDDPGAYDEGPWGQFVPELLSSVPSVLVVDAVTPPD
jgi:SAM-dependent methyltransferase